MKRYLTVTVGKWEGSVTLDSLTTASGVTISGKNISKIWLGRFADIEIRKLDGSVNHQELYLKLEETNGSVSREYLPLTASGTYSVICLDSIKRDQGIHEFSISILPGDMTTGPSNFSYSIKLRVAILPYRALLYLIITLVFTYLAFYILRWRNFCRFAEWRWNRSWVMGISIFSQFFLFIFFIAEF